MKRGLGSLALEATQPRLAGKGRRPASTEPPHSEMPGTVLAGIEKLGTKGLLAIQWLPLCVSKGA